MRITQDRWIAIDVETTGRDAEHDRIIELGAVVFHQARAAERYQQLVNPTTTISAEIQSITGISNDDVHHQPTFADVAQTWYDLLATAPLLAYNHTFDIGFLQNEFQRAGLPPWNPPPCLDPFPFCWHYLRKDKKTPNAQLGTVCEYLGIPLSSAHRADHDAEAAGHVLLALLSHYPIPDELEDFLHQQRAFGALMEDDFQRFRRRSKSDAGPSLSSSTLRIELGPGYPYGDEPDPIRALIRRMPDVRDLRRNTNS